MPMYTIPLFLGVITAWPVIGVMIFTLVDPDTDALYHFVKKYDSKVVREWHIFVWPYVIWIFYKHLRDKNK